MSAAGEKLRFGGPTSTSFRKNDGRPRYRGKVLWDGMTFRDICRAEASKCLKLLKLARDNEKVPWVIRVQAANALLDRAFGKATQPLEIAQTRPLGELDREAIRSEIEALRTGGSASQRVVIEGEYQDASVQPVTGGAVVTASQALTCDDNALSDSVPQIHTADGSK